MRRLNVIDPSADTGSAAEVLAGPLNNMQTNIFRGMANDADVLKTFAASSQGVKAGAPTAAGDDDTAIAEVIGELAVITFTDFVNQLNHTGVGFPAAATL
jgi:hypothetical protein